MIRHKKPTEAKNKKTYVAYVLDKSSSMESIRDATISAFNEQVDEAKKSGGLGGQTSLSLIQFSGEVEETFFNIPVDEIEGKIDREQYNPNGCTAMFDAIGYTLKKLQRYDEAGDVGFLVVVLSDGEENSSKKYTGADITSLRKELEGTGRWTFMFIGCDENALKTATKTGFASVNFVNTPQGMATASSNLIGTSNTYFSTRAAGHTSMSNAEVSQSWTENLNQSITSLDTIPGN